MIDIHELATRLPQGFRLGTSTAAYQIEGGVADGGRGRSIWDAFTHEPGHVINNENGDVAIDHYHRLEEDLDYIADLGAPDYRFSISWSRVLPTGRGELNPEGIAFYDRLVDGLLERGIRPCPTLFHWDLPEVLQQEGGWMNRDTCTAFASYARLMAEHFGDRVQRWATMNEMSVHSLYGHALGSHAPGLQMGLGAMAVVHRLLLAHGMAVQAIREVAPYAEVGVINQNFPVIPASDSPEDLQAAGMFDLVTNQVFVHPILTGEYPVTDVYALMTDSPEQIAADLAIISTPIDFYGLNYYEPTVIEAPKAGKDYSGNLEVDIPADMPFQPVPYASAERTDFGWAVAPEGLTRILLHLHETYPNLPPVTVTENGASYHDVPAADGSIDDQARIRYLAQHIAACADAIDAGVDVRGYYCWSTFDNFEWAAGYQERFGLIYVDYETLKRTPKASYTWYRDLARALRGSSSL